MGSRASRQHGCSVDCSEYRENNEIIRTLATVCRCKAAIMVTGSGTIDFR